MSWRREESGKDGGKDDSLCTEAGECAQGHVAISGGDGRRKQCPAALPISSALAGL